MPTVTLVVDVQGALAQLGNVRRDQIPYATSLAINRTARDVALRLQAEMATVFDRPTPFTLKAIQVKDSNKYRLPLMAIVELRDDAAKGTPPTKYLWAEIFGGPRRPKRSEKAMQYRGILPSGMFIVPGPGMKLDAYGNIPDGTMTAIMDALGSNVLDPLQNATRKTKTRRRNLSGNVFVGKPNGRHLGVYKREGRRITALLFFVRQPFYPQRFRFFDIAIREAQAKFGANFGEAWARAMATAY